MNMLKKLRLFKDFPLRKKSQVSIEFLIAIGFILVIFILLLWLINDRRVEIRKTEQYMEERNLCLKISNLINGVFLNGDGNRVDIEVDYQVQVSNRTMYVGPDKVVCNFIPEDVSNSTNRFFLLNKGNIRIRNDNGVVVIKNV